MKTKEKKCGWCGDFFIPKASRGHRCFYCEPQWKKSLSLLRSAKGRAERKGLPFDVDVGWVERRLRVPCPRTGINFSILDGWSMYSPSLDRIDPSRGYVKDNVQVVTWWYNSAKQRLTDHELEQLCRRVVETASLCATNRARSVEAKIT